MSDTTKQTREHIIAAARAVIAEQGFEAASVSAIVERAGVAKGSFYTYFKSKSDLPLVFVRILQQDILHKIILEIFHDAAQDTHPVPLLEKVVPATYDILQSYNDILACIDWSLLLTDFDQDTGDDPESLKFHMKLIFQQWRDAKLIAADIDMEIGMRLFSAVLQRMHFDLLINPRLDKALYLQQATLFLCRGLGTPLV